LGEGINHDKASRSSSAIMKVPSVGSDGKGKKSSLVSSKGMGNSEAPAVYGASQQLKEGGSKGKAGTTTSLSAGQMNRQKDRPRTVSAGIVAVGEGKQGKGGKRDIDGSSKRASTPSFPLISK
jgi:hypothetical protein